MDKYQEMAKNHNSPDEIMNIASTIAKVYVDNYDNYLKNVYPQAKKDMEERMNQLSQHMKIHSFVKDWERVTGYTWNRGDYHWLLYRAGAKGPSYNNLNENTNTVVEQYKDYIAGQVLATSITIGAVGEEAVDLDMDDYIIKASITK